MSNETTNPTATASADSPALSGYALDVRVTGASAQEAWSNLLDVVCYACECKQKQEGLWPHMVSTDGGKITVQAHTSDYATGKS